MKLVTAVIQPFMIDKLARVLRKQRITGYTVTRVEGSGRDMVLSPDYLHPRAKFEIAVNEAQVSALTETIIKTVGTHQEGDGIIYVTPIVSAVNIQTAQENEAALSVD